MDPQRCVRHGLIASHRPPTIYDLNKYPSRIACRVRVVKYVGQVERTVIRPVQSKLRGQIFLVHGQS